VLPGSLAGSSGALAADTGGSSSDPEEVIREIKRRLDDAAGLVMSGSGDEAEVLLELAEAEALVELILDPAAGPVLSPPDAGAVEKSVDPVTLHEHAGSCCILALEAVVAVLTDPDGKDELLGSKLKTIRYLLPRYEQLVQEMED
jgi:hypothetical protein